MEKFDDLMARTTKIRSPTYCYHGNVKRLRRKKYTWCMDVGKQSYFTVNGT